jgi:hypothetical protein
MRRQVLTLIGVLSLVLLAAGSAVAKTLNIRAGIPFKFVINKQTLPSGQYSITTLAASNGRTLMIRSNDSRVATIVNSNSTQSLNPSKQTKLVFRRYGDRYFLSQVWVAGEALGHQLPKSGRETEVALNNAPQEVVVMAELR